MRTRVDGFVEAVQSVIAKMAALSRDVDDERLTARAADLNRRELGVDREGVAVPALEAAIKRWLLSARPDPPFFKLWLLLGGHEGRPARVTGV